MTARLSRFAIALAAIALAGLTVRLIFTVVVDPDAQYFGTTLTNGSLLPSEHAQLGEIRFEDWLGAPATPKP